ncbi:MAG: hypothetical protein PHN77_07365 [Thermoguttaceae bacterium]|jgi:hypothetical protein|nr:hypothetical protein [Thermoguttaceae bacterium]
MNFTARTLLAICFAAALAGNTPAGAPLADPLAGRPSWKPAEWTDLRAQVLEWLGRQQAAESPRNEVLQKWPEAGSGETPDLLTLLVETFALVDQDIRALVGALAAAQPGHFPDTACLRDESRPPLVRNNCRLYVGRWAAQHEFYDEASALVDDLRPEETADPATLLFYQAIVRQRLLKKAEGLKAVDELLRGEADCPRRYAAVARLLRGDLEQLEDDSLDHIARRMDDVRRRLSLGRADQQVRKVEVGVIESLDKLIEELKQRQQQADPQAGAPSGSQSIRPADESRILPGRGPGEVTKKSIGTKSGWGDLPPKQREAALQQIGREFPAHYRDAVEQYFRRLAGSDKDEK